MIHSKLRNLEKGLKQEEASPLLDKLVFDKVATLTFLKFAYIVHSACSHIWSGFFQIRQGFGGRVRLILSGAAPLPKHIEEFLRVTCCCVLSQGYGMCCFANLLALAFPFLVTDDETMLEFFVYFL